MIRILNLFSLRKQRISFLDAFSRSQCQLGVLPLGTGNDLSRVLGWGTSFDDDTAVTQFLRHLERAKAAVLDR